MTAIDSHSPILEVRDLSKRFPVRNAFGRRTGWAEALRDVSFEIAKGEVFAVVGESGSGKSTLGKTIAGIHQASGGAVIFEGFDITSLTPRQGRRRRRNLQYCYQDPGASLDPRWKIRRSLEEPLIIHENEAGTDRRRQVADIIRAVGLPEQHLDLYPHEISGGQQRRVGLARILMLRPSVVILDEPTSGLDVSVQANVLSLFLELRRQFQLTYLFISHDLSVVRMLSDRVAVMYLGRIVELGRTEEVFSDPRHPYTRSLVDAIPVIGGRRVTDGFALKGEPPSITRVPSGCSFRSRCPMARSECASELPPLRVSGERRMVACHLAA